MQQETPNTPTGLTSTEKALCLALEAIFARVGSNDDPGHDLHHARRVRTAALEIATHTPEANRRVLMAAAYLHDVVNLPKDAPDRAQASARSAAVAAAVLPDVGFPAVDIAATCHAIVAHSFSAGVPPETLEARILQDADRLEAIGAIGIARAYYTAGRLKSGLFDGADPFARDRPLNDLRFATDHFAVKLLRLPDTLQTDGGRILARQRVAVMRQFLAALGEELDCPCPW